MHDEGRQKNPFRKDIRSILKVKLPDQDHPGQRRKKSEPERNWSHVAHEDGIEKGKKGQKADVIENDTDRESDFLKLRKLVGAHESDQQNNEKKTRDGRSGSEIEDRIDREKRPKEKVHYEIMKFPKTLSPAYRDEFTQKDFNFHEKECAEKDKIEALLNQVEEVIDSSESKEIEDESTGKYGCGNENLVSFIVL